MCMRRKKCPVDWEHSKILKTQFYFRHCYGGRKTVKNTKDEEKVKENERE